MIRTYWPIKEKWFVITTISEEANVFIFVGRIAEEKNIQLILNAFETYLPSRILIVGSGPIWKAPRISERGLTIRLSVLTGLKIPDLVTITALMRLFQPHHRDPRFTYIEAMAVAYQYSLATWVSLACCMRMRQAICLKMRRHSSTKSPILHIFTR